MIAIYRESHPFLTYVGRTMADKSSMNMMSEKHSVLVDLTIYKNVFI